MLAYPIATAVLLLGQGGAAAAKKSRGRKLHSAKPEFLRKMDGHERHAQARQSVEKLRRKLRDDTPAEFAKELRSDTKKAKELRQKIVERSTVVKHPGEGNERRRRLEDAAANDDAAAANDDANANAYQDNGAYNAYNYANNNNGNYVYDEDGNLQYKYDKDEDGVDDYFQVFGDWENSFGFDVTQFSLSYNRCASVRQFDDEVAAMEDTSSVFATKVFAVFRFCPVQTCMGWQAQTYEWECDDNIYGEEYCRALRAYMEVMEEMNEEFAPNSGWNGYSKGGQAQADNWMYQNYDKYSGNEVQYDENGNPYGYGAYEAKCVCDDPDFVQDAECQMFCNGRGARGEGCQSNYGEYMMEMQDYLDIMLEWQEERFEQYCEYCQECMYDVYEMWLSNGGNVYNNQNYYQNQNQNKNNRKLSFEEFKNAGGIRGLANNNNNNNNQQDQQDQEDYEQQMQNYYQVCPEYDTCSEYYNICQEGQEEDMYSDYFDCQEAQSSSGQEAYVGLHCADDGYTLTLGVYADEYCNDYIGNGVNVNNFIQNEDGSEFEEDQFNEYYNSAFGPTLSHLKYINEDNVCIPCSEKELLWVDRENDNGHDDDRYNNNNQAQNEGYGINDLCENAYMVSARCDKHYRSYNTRAKQAKFSEAVASEDLTCDFIDSIVMGNYNETGEIGTGDDLSGRERLGLWLVNNNRAQPYAQGVGNSIARVSPLQIFGLIASILAVVVLAMWAASLRGSLAKGWVPRRGLRAAPAIGQQNSGIMMGRDTAPWRPKQAATTPDLRQQDSGIVRGRSDNSYYMS